MGAELDHRVLERLLSPLSTAEFLRSDYQRAPRLIRGDGKRFDDLCSWRALNEVLRWHSGGFRDPDFSFQLDGEPHPIRGDLDLGSFYSLWRQGGALLVRDIHERHAPLLELVERMQRVFRREVSVHLFACATSTCPAYPLHFDSSDIFVLQIAGSKEWSLYPCPIESPLTTVPAHKDFLVRQQAEERRAIAEGGGDRSELRPPLHLRTRLREGDVLYLPRGWLHEARPLGEPTLHLTFWLKPVTGADLMHHLVDEATERLAILRADLPLLGTPTEQEHRVTALRVAMASILEAPGSIEALMRSRSEQHRPPVPPFSLDAETCVDPVPDDGSLRLRWLPGYAIRADRDAVEDEMTFCAMGTHASYQGRAELGKRVFDFVAERAELTLAEIYALEGVTLEDHPTVRQFLGTLVYRGLVGVEREREH